MTHAHALHWLTQTLADVPKNNNWLTNSERGILEKKRVLKRRTDWRLGRWTAKRAFQAYLENSAEAPDLCDIDIRSAPDGAPEVFVAGKQAAAAISISHSKGVCLCVISSGEAAVGCDLEIVEPRSESFISDFFTPKERALVLEHAPADRHLLATLIWSAKESALKALREGLRRDTRSVEIEVSLKNSNEIWNSLTVRCSETTRTIQGWWRSTGDYVQTVTVEGRGKEPVELMIS